MPAADFEGCIRSYTSPPKKEVKLDFLGKPIITGWEMQENREKKYIYYIDTKNPLAVKVRGVYGRYVLVRAKLREFIPRDPGSTGYSTTIGTSTTNCYGFGDSFSCSTTPATTFNTPGRFPTPAYIRSSNFGILIDCVKRTSREYEDGTSHFRKERWKDDPGRSTRYCPRINSMQKTTYRGLEKGNPTKDDLLAKDEQKFYNLFYK